MSPKEKHPHIEGASDVQIAGLLQKQTPDIINLYLEMHRLVLDVLPDVKTSTDTVDGATGYGSRQYGYDGWGMAALMAHTRWVSLVFFRGNDLEDPTGLLEGTGKSVRHVKMRTADQIKEKLIELAALIKAASLINEP